MTQATYGPDRRRSSRWLASAALLGVMALAAHAVPGSGASAPPVAARGADVLALRLADVIGPASADFIERGLEDARERRAQLVVLELDTPGGLDTSMRQIVQAILASPVPVATFVFPEGARAASAGTYILYASHIAAMAPATNLGAATPVQLQGSTAAAAPAEAPAPADASPPGGAARSNADSLRQKAVNDAVAYLQGLADLRGRSREFAERAVRDAASLAADEAKKAGVIEYVALDLADLLRQLDGVTVKTSAAERTLSLANPAIELIEPDWRNRLLATIAHPQVAIVLMLIGIYGLFFEFTSPGFGVPGVAGAIFLLLGLYAFQLLPINWVGVALIGLGAVLMIAEAFLPSFGALGIGGIVGMLLGALFLMDTEAPGFGVQPVFMIGLAIASALILFGIGTMAERSRRLRVVSGAEDLVGSVGVVSHAGADGSWAEVRGESWRVSAAEPLAAGQRVRVVRLAGLTLEVETER